MTNFVDGDGVPLGFGMELAQNSEAMTYFASLDPAKRRQLMARAHSIGSKKEMRDFVAHLREY